jgi:hypothetical protein
VRVRHAGLAFHGGHDVRHLSGAQRGVDLGDLVPQLGVVTLGQATRDHQPLRAPGVLLPGHLEHRVHRLLLGAVDEGAGVHDE